MYLPKQNVIFEEERSNLYLDLVRETEECTDALGKLQYRAELAAKNANCDSQIRRMYWWVYLSFQDMVGNVLEIDGSLGPFSKPAPFCLFYRLLVVSFPTCADDVSSSYPSSETQKIFSANIADLAIHVGAKGSTKVFRSRSSA